MLKKLQKNIFSIKTDADFQDICMRIFDYQIKNNKTYRFFAESVGRSRINDYTDIPFLPIEFFKTQKILIDGFETADYFASSGTTGTNRSKHFIADYKIYEESFTKGFEYFFGPVENYCILALLPNYMEQNHSSLIYMIDHLIKQSAHPDSGFYLHNHNELRQKLQDMKTEKVILFGVSYALLDLIESQPLQLENTIIFETGGMKGRRKELSKAELHQTLSQGFGVDKIYSEYGMTELFSQAYSKGDGIFNCPPWMRILIRPTTDPLGLEEIGRRGGINVIDLANLYSCPFIATQDLGRLHPDRSFEVLGRISGSDIRGCNLMVD